MLFKFAVRNVFRNKKRSFLTALAVFFGAMIVSLALGWMSGMLDMLAVNYLNYETANMKIVTEGYFKRSRFFPVDELVYNPQELEGEIRKVEGVSSIEERIRFGMLLGKGERTTEAMGMGINLLSNRMNIASKITNGKMEESGIYIGAGLAAKLKATVGDELLLVSKTSEGGLNGIKLPVKGIFFYNISMYDDKVFYIGLNDAKKLLKIHDATTEIYVYTKTKDLTFPVQKKIQAFLPEGLLVLNYREQIEFFQLLDMMGIILYFVYAVILFLASFVVINTMMMAIFERIKEIGTLKAMGMTDRELFFNFILEGGIIGAMGGTFGAIAGYIIVFIMNRVGLDFSAATKGMDFPFESMIRPYIGVEVIFISIVMSIIIPALATMIPARYAKNLTSAEALRK